MTTRPRSVWFLGLLLLGLTSSGCGKTDQEKHIKPDDPRQSKKTSKKNHKLEHVRPEVPDMPAREVVEISFRGTSETEWQPARAPSSYVGQAILVLEDNRFPVTAEGKDILGQVFRITGASQRSVQLDPAFPRIRLSGNRWVKLRCQIVPPDTKGKPPTPVKPDPVDPAVLAHKPIDLKGVYKGAGPGDVSALEVRFKEDNMSEIVFLIGQINYTLPTRNEFWLRQPDGKYAIGYPGSPAELTIEHDAKKDSLNVVGVFRVADKEYKLTGELVRPDKKSTAWKSSSSTVKGGGTATSTKTNEITGLWQAPPGTPRFKSFLIDFKFPIIDLSYVTADNFSFKGQFLADDFKKTDGKKQWIYQQFKDGELVCDIILELSDNGQVLKVTGQITSMLRVRDLALVRPMKKKEE